MLKAPKWIRPNQDTSAKCDVCGKPLAGENWRYRTARGVLVCKDHLPSYAEPRPQDRNAYRRAQNAILREVCGTSARAAREDMGL